MKHSESKATLPSEPEEISAEEFEGANFKITMHPNLDKGTSVRMAKCVASYLKFMNDIGPGDFEPNDQERWGLSCIYEFQEQLIVCAEKVEEAESDARLAAFQAEGQAREKQGDSPLMKARRTQSLIKIANDMLTGAADDASGVSSEESRVLLDLQGYLTDVNTLIDSRLAELSAQRPELTVDTHS